MTFIYLNTLKIYSTCNSCRETLPHKTETQTRLELAMREGKTITCKCLHCNANQSIHVNDFKAQYSKLPQIIAILFLPLHFFLFPQWFFPEPSPDGINCGLPTLGIVLVFWTFGTLGILITHILWLKRNRKIKAKFE